MRRKTQNYFLRSQSILTNGLKTKRERNLETLGDPVLLGEKEGIKKNEKQKEERIGGSKQKRPERKKKNKGDERAREGKGEGGKKLVENILEICPRFSLHCSLDDRKKEGGGKMEKKEKKQTKNILTHENMNRKRKEQENCYFRGCWRKGSK